MHHSKHAGNDLRHIRNVAIGTFLVKSYPVLTYLQQSADLCIGLALFFLPASSRTPLSTFDRIGIFLMLDQTNFQSFFSWRAEERWNKWMLGRWQSFRHSAFSDTSGCSSFQQISFFFMCVVTQGFSRDCLFKNWRWGIFLTFSHFSNYLRFPRLDRRPHHSWLLFTESRVHIQWVTVAFVCLEVFTFSTFTRAIPLADMNHDHMSSTWCAHTVSCELNKERTGRVLALLLWERDVPGGRRFGFWLNGSLA